MFIDKRGKLFGKVSIVDLIIVIIILVPVLYFTVDFKGVSSSASPSGQLQDINITFNTASIPSHFVSEIKKGDKVKDTVSNKVFGEVVNVVIDDTIAYGFDSNGKSVASAMPGYNSVTLTVKGKGEYRNNRAYFNGIEYFENKALGVVAGKTGLWVRVIGDIQLY